MDGKLATVDGFEPGSFLEPRFAAAQCSVSSAASCAASATSSGGGQSGITNAMLVPSRRLISCPPRSLSRGHSRFHSVAPLEPAWYSTGGSVSEAGPVWDR
jgi:hypothetical protein